MVTGIETLWVLHRDAGLPAICSLAQTRQDCWTLTITYGSITMLSEMYPSDAQAVAIAKQFREGLEKTGWHPAADDRLARNGGG